MASELLHTKVWLGKLSVWFGSFSLLSLFILKIATIFVPPDAYFSEQVRLSLFTLVFFPLPGTAVAMIAILLGVISYKRARAHTGLIGCALGAMTILLVLFMILSRDGAQFQCRYIHSPTE